jgi:hypothetical protein
MSQHLELLSRSRFYLETLLEREIHHRQETSIPPDEFWGPANTAEREEYYLTTTNPELLALIQEIEAAEQVAEEPPADETQTEASA